jgi:hypothetical protein
MARSIQKLSATCLPTPLRSTTVVQLQLNGQAVPVVGSGYQCLCPGKAYSLSAAFAGAQVRSVYMTTTLGGLQTSDSWCGSTSLLMQV